jgi:hypothetical protein
MGGVVSGLGNALGSVVSLPSTIAGAIPGVGKIAGPIVGGLTGGPLGFATSLAGNALTGQYGGGGGGGSNNSAIYADPTIKYGTGNNTYTYGGNPFDTSKYFITGDKGVYNLLPQLANPYADKTKYDAMTGTYNTYQNIYNSMRDDATAQAAFAKAFAPQTYTPTYNFTPNKKNPTTGSFALNKNFTGPNSYLADDLYNNVAAFNPTGTVNPIKYVDFGFGPTGSTIGSIANYAATNKNPFFTPFAPKPPPPPPPAPANPAPPSREVYKPVDIKKGGIVGLLD